MYNIYLDSNRGGVVSRDFREANSSSSPSVQGTSRFAPDRSRVGGHAAVA